MLASRLGSLTTVLTWLRSRACAGMQGLALLALVVVAPSGSVQGITWNCEHCCPYVAMGSARPCPYHLPPGTEASPCPAKPTLPWPQSRPLVYPPVHQASSGAQGIFQETTKMRHRPPPESRPLLYPPPVAPVGTPPHPTGHPSIETTKIRHTLRNLLRPWGPCPYHLPPPEPKPLDPPPALAPPSQPFPSGSGTCVWRFLKEAVRWGGYPPELAWWTGG